MKRFLATVALASLLASPALADGTIDTLLGAGAIVGTESIPIFQTANPAVKATATAIGNAGSLTGDVTKSVSSTTTTLATVNANVGSFGSATQCTAFTTNAKGLITAASATTCTPAIASVTGLGTGVATFLATPTSANLAAALTDETGTGASVFGTAPTISSPTINTAATLGYLAGGGIQCLHSSNTGAITGTGADCGSGSGAVSSVTGGIGVTVSPTTGAVIVSTAAVQRNNTTTSDTLVSGDAGTVVTENNASPVAVSIAQAGTTGFANSFYWTLKNKGAGLVTLTPTTSTIDGAASISLSQNQSIDFYSDGANYWTLPGKPVNAAIASGTAALGTSAIASGACATAVTASATGVATTDVVTASFNGDPTAVTGYIPATAGMLTIITYPTANNVNFKVCNNTSASITPGAITLNWRVVR